MLKYINSMKTAGNLAQQTLRMLLERVPAIKIIDIVPTVSGLAREPDFVAQIEVAGKRYVLVCEVQSNAQPRHVRISLLEMRNYMARHPDNATPVFIAPYLSDSAQELCREEGASFLDFEGNAQLSFGTVFIERRVANKPASDRRELRSLFKPKSAQVLRVMLQNPTRPWRVADLAQAARVSLGHVSNVRVALLDREWGRLSDEGLFLAEPDALLDSWRNSYEAPSGQRLTFYTALHGKAFDEAARQAMRSGGGSSKIAYASFSSANWLAPYARTGSSYLYANEEGLNQLETTLNLSDVTGGENVVVTLLDDPDLFIDMVEPADGVVCTSAVQTYLDLAASGERGNEASEHLRQEKPQSAADYDDRTTAAVKTVLIEIGQILGGFKGKYAVVGGFAVQRADGVDLAMHFYQFVAISGAMPTGGTNTVEIAVCSIAALLAMKGHAIYGRFKQKDADDIYYCILNFPGGYEALAKECRPLLAHPSGALGYSYIAEKFATPDSLGPTCVRQFVEETNILGERSCAQWQQDAFGQVNAWLRALGLLH